MDAPGKICHVAQLGLSWGEGPASAADTPAQCLAAAPQRVPTQGTLVLLRSRG